MIIFKLISQVPFVGPFVSVEGFQHVLHVYEENGDVCVFVRTVRIEIFMVYTFSWILWYTSYPRKLIHNN